MDGPSPVLPSAEGGVFPFVEIDPVDPKSSAASDGDLNGLPNALDAGELLAIARRGAFVAPRARPRFAKTPHWRPGRSTGRRRLWEV
jgi:hypothetical protein